LRDKSKAELDVMEQWYCEDCIVRIQREEAGLNPDEEDLMVEVDDQPEGNDMYVNID
jgi:ADP-ribose pyrophosphatase YjhB (NUDIX family)